MRTMAMLAGLGATVLGLVAGCSGQVGGAGEEPVGTTSADLSSPSLWMTVDSNFGGGGREVIAHSSGVVSESPAATVLAGEYLYVAATDAFADGTTALVVRRFQSEGAADSTFASVPLFRSTNAAATAIAVQPDGKVLVAGHSSQKQTTGCYALARLDVDGTPDPTFQGGQVSTCVGINGAWAGAMALQPNGQILLAGNILRADRNGDAGLTRYNADGSVDTTFGTGGTAVGPLPGFNGQALLVESSGRIVVAGNQELVSQTETVVEGFTASGALDGTFGGGGWNRIAFAALDRQTVYSMQQTRSGDLLVGGSHFSFGQSATYGYIVAFTSAGAVDGSFGNGGTRNYDFDANLGNGSLTAIMPMVDGSLLAVGYGNDTQEAAILHLDQYGAVDSQLAPGGVLYANVAPYGAGFDTAGIAGYSAYERFSPFPMYGRLILAGGSGTQEGEVIGLAAFDFKYL